jgi:hypothetical protein
MRGDEGLLTDIKMKPIRHFEADLLATIQRIMAT